MITRHLESADDRGVLWDAVFRNLQGRSALQIGARPGGSWESFFEDLADRGFTTFDVVEAHPPYAEGLQSPYLRPGSVLCTDILDLAPDLPDNGYDVVIWHHGPEHVERRAFEEVLPHLQRVASIALYVGMPHGRWPQGDLGGNNYDRHLTHWQPEEIASLGFDVHTFGPPDQQTSMFGVRWTLKRQRDTMRLACASPPQST